MMNNKIPKLSGQGSITARYKNASTQKKAAIWYMICNILQRGISFLVVPIYTRVLTTTEYGAYSVFHSWREILMIFATMNFYCGVFTKAMVDHTEDRDAYTSCIQTLSFVVTCVFSLIFCAMHGQWMSLFGMDTVTSILLLLFFATYPALQFWSTRQNVEYKYVKMVIVTLIVSVAVPVISLLLLFYSDLRERAVIWGFLLVQIAVGGIFFVLNLCRGKLLYNKEYWLHAIRFNIPLIPHYLSLIVLGQADRIMIQHYCGDDKAGIYSLAHQISMTIHVVTSAINSAFLPWTYMNMRDGTLEQNRKAYDQLCVLVGGLTFLIALVAPEAVRILGTEEYMEAIWVIPAIMLSVYFTFVYGMFSNVEFYYGATQYVMIASVSGAILNIILNAVFIPIFGFQAAGYTTAFSYFGFMVMHYIFMSRVCKVNEVPNEAYDMKHISLITVALTLMMAIGMMTYGYWFLRYTLAAGILVILFLFRKNIADWMKNSKVND